ncbi:MAG TPA: GspE/PulE family protein [Acidobacteriaceae bacterium]|nr:GspE/PulE family protein [Acidobacteriaceae bacterium]
MSAESILDVASEVEAFAAANEGRGGRFGRRTAESTSTDAPVVQIVEKIIANALRLRSSDVHIEPQDSRIRVRFRIDGVLNEILSLPPDMSSGIVSRIKILGGMNIVERRKPQDGQFSMTIDEREIDVRVSTTGVVWGEKVVLRILDKTRSVYTLEALGMPAATHAKYSSMINSPYGMVICAGPTGSGKTTTLYASLTEINGTDKNVTTIEDPVEYVFPSINQIQINEAAGVTFANGLRSILRQDPDAILVGEMRDVETARIAVQSALTGHFVLSSLHSTDAVSALYRFLDMGIEPFLVASSVIGIVGQRLVRKICDNCKESYLPSEHEMTFYQGAGGTDKSAFFHGAGCDHCAGSGFMDRIGIYELLNISEPMREVMTRRQPSHEEMRLVAEQEGMSPMRQEALRLVAEDTTTISEVIRTIYTL